MEDLKTSMNSYDGSHVYHPHGARIHQERRNGTQQGDPLRDRTNSPAPSGVPTDALNEIKAKARDSGPEHQQGAGHEQPGDMDLAKKEYDEISALLDRLSHWSDNDVQEVIRKEIKQRRIPPSSAPKDTGRTWPTKNWPKWRSSKIPASADARGRDRGGSSLDYLRGRGFRSQR